jgi:hypothetical protein
MHKFLIACTLAVGVGGGFGSAFANTAVKTDYVQPAAVSHSMVSNADLSYTVARLNNEVQALEAQVQSLRSPSQFSDDVDQIPTGG